MDTSISEPNEGYGSDSVLSPSFEEQELIINDINRILKKAFIFIYHSLNYCQRLGYDFAEKSAVIYKIYFDMAQNHDEL